MEGDCGVLIICVLLVKELNASDACSCYYHRQMLSVNLENFLMCETIVISQYDAYFSMQFLYSC